MSLSSDRQCSVCSSRKMDAFGIILFLLLSCGIMTRAQDLESTTTAPAITTAEVITETTTVELSTDPPVNNCTTARGLSGKCVIRQNCDFGTAAIDRTLYAPKGYKRPCAQEEACCPNEFIVIPPPTERSQNDDLDLED